MFTLNYDLCIETVLKHLKVRYATGFAHYKSMGVWNPQTFDYDKSMSVWNPKTFGVRNLKVRLFKLHGSLDWELGGLTPIILGFQEKIALIDPFWFLWNAFVRSVRGSEILVIIGYSFRDVHVNLLLDEAATRGVDLVIVQPDFNAVYQWASRLKKRANPNRITPLFFTAKEALLGEHVLHALWNISLYKKAGFRFPYEKHNWWDYLKGSYMSQHGRPPP